MIAHVQDSSMRSSPDHLPSGNQKRFELLRGNSSICRCSRPHFNLVVFLQNRITVQLNMSEHENGQAVPINRGGRSKIPPERWEQIKTAHASGIGLREIARNMGLAEGTVLAHAKRKGWTREIQNAKALAKREETPLTVTPVEAVATSMQQRGERHVERMAGVSERGVDHIETMDGPEILNSVDQIEKLDKVARRTFGISDAKEDPTQWAVNIAILGL
jgi:hypothetical protein